MTFSLSKELKRTLCGLQYYQLPRRYLLKLKLGHAADALQNSKSEFGEHFLALNKKRGTN